MTIGLRLLLIYTIANGLFLLSELSLNIFGVMLPL